MEREEAERLELERKKILVHIKETFSKEPSQTGVRYKGMYHLFSVLRGPDTSNRQRPDEVCRSRTPAQVLKFIYLNAVQSYSCKETEKHSYDSSLFVFSPPSAFCIPTSFSDALSLLAATFAKLSVGLTLGARVREGARGDDTAAAAEGGGVRVRAKGRSDPDRELVLDMDKRSRSFSTRSVISFSLADTSTGLEDIKEDLPKEAEKTPYLAAPKGFERDEAGGVGPILGDDNGLGEAEALPERGKRSSFRRPI